MSNATNCLTRGCKSLIPDSAKQREIKNPRKDDYISGGSEILSDIYGGLSVGIAHSFYILQNYSKRVRSFIFHPLKNIIGNGNENSMKDKTITRDKSSLEVIGVGFGRTGTVSLSLALNEIGLPTLHTQELYHDHEIFSMWIQKVFLPSLNEKKTTMGSPDFDLIASHGYKATTDLPMALYFKEISELYPNSKFILTTRENSEAWYRSWETMTSSITQAIRYGSFLSDVKYYGYYIRWLFSVVNDDASYLTEPFPLSNQKKDAAIASYEAHNQRVREIIPSERLLEFNVKDGWNPLCDFLEVEKCPSTPFPKSNSSRSVKIQSVSALIFPLIVSLTFIFPLLLYFFQTKISKTFVAWLIWKVKRTYALIKPYSKIQQKTKMEESTCVNGTRHYHTPPKEQAQKQR